MPEEESLARPGQRQMSARRTAPRQQRRVRHHGDVVSVLARTAREVEAAARRCRVTPAVRTKFQAIALLLRDERARIRAVAGSDSHRAEQLRRLDGIATILATTAVRDAGLMALLGEDADVADAARSLKREMLRELGIGPAPAGMPPAGPATVPAGPERQVVPQSVVSRQLANPFLAPDFSAVPQRTSRPRRLAGWELLGPLLSSFERAGGGAPACMALPAPTARFTPPGLKLMPHQGQLVAAAAAGHRTFLLADEPGLGKTAQALLAAEAANAYPLLVVVPNVVKTNWAREAARWTPRHPATVVHGDGEAVDGFADIVVLNYEVLGRHMGWLGDFGFRGMVVDEAHFMKNKTSQRSQNVLALSSRIRSRTDRPLLLALTGTPFINDIEDFRAIWQFLGWIDDSKPLDELTDVLEDTGLTPADRGFYPAARQCVIDLGIVPRRKLHVAAALPPPRIAAPPLHLAGHPGRSIRAADPDVAVAVCSLTAAGVGLNLQVASNIVLAEMSWTDAEQTQAIDRSHRIGQPEPVTAWRIIAAETIDARIAGLIDSKAGLAARALDGSDQEVSSSADVKLETLVALLTDTLRASFGHGDALGS